MEQFGHKLDSFKELIQKVVNVETKAALQSRSAACETDQHCFQSIWPVNSTAAKN